MNITEKCMQFCLSLFLATVLFGCGGSGSDANAAAVGEACGGSEQTTCADATAYCKFPQGGCGDNNGAGVCEQRPEFCAMVFKPVCGCDGKTYSNDCVAGTAGVSVRSEGACEE